MEQARNQLAFTQVKPKRVIDDIANQIKKMIYSGSLKPEDRLPPEKDLAASFGTGRMTVREALRMLEATGHIYIKQGAEGGAFVKKLDASSLTLSITGLVEVGSVSHTEVTKGRLAVESLLLESSIVNATDKHIKALDENIRWSELEINPKNPIAPPGTLSLFHILLAEPSDNRLLKYFLHSMVELSGRFIQEHQPNMRVNEDHIKQHKEILEEFKKRNLEGARKVLEAHLISTGDEIASAVKSRK